jgi:hypothetical protein
LVSLFCSSAKSSFSSSFCFIFEEAGQDTDFGLAETAREGEEASDARLEGRAAGDCASPCCGFWTSCQDHQRDRAGYNIFRKGAASICTRVQAGEVLD